jgi:hypothetical protein
LLRIDQAAAQQVQGADAHPKLLQMLQRWLLLTGVG